MPDSIGKLALILSGNSSALQRDLQRAGSMVDSFGSDVRKKFDRMSADLARTNLLSTPFNVQRAAGLELAQESAQQTLRKKVEAAKESMMPTVKPLGRLEGLGFKLGSPFGGKAGNALSGIGAGMDSVLGGLTKFVPHAMIAAAAIGTLTAATVGLWKMGMAFAAKANPYALERYNQAWDDLQAVLGQRFVPIVNLAIEGVRLIADFLATILPSAEEVEAAIAPFKQDMKELREALADIAPLVKAYLVEQLKQAAMAIKFFADQVRMLILLARSMPGGSAIFGSGALPGSGGLANSFGAAAQSRQFMGLEELSRANILAGMDTQQSVPVQQLDEQKTTNSKLDLLIAVARGASDPFGTRRGILGF